MYVLGSVCSQHKHRSQIRHLVLSVIGVHKGGDNLKVEHMP